MGAREPGNLESCDSGSLGAWEPGSLGAWESGSLEKSGSVGAKEHASLQNVSEPVLLKLDRAVFTLVDSDFVR